MTTLEPKSPLFPRTRPALLAVFAAVIIVAGLSPNRADATPPEASATRPGSQAAKPPTAVVGSAQPTKQTAAKPKTRPRVTPRSAKPAPARPAKVSATPAIKPVPAPAAKPTQVMDFDPDQVEGQRLEPGFELIEGAPRRARQPSMVPPPSKPDESVVKGN